MVTANLHPYCRATQLPSYTSNIMVEYRNMADRPSACSMIGTTIMFQASISDDEIISTT